MLHVLVYGAVSLVPAWTPPPRTGLIVTDLSVSEPPAPAIATPGLVTPPRPLARPQPSTSRAERARPESAAKIEPSIEREASEPPAQAEPTIVAADETARGAIAAPSASTPSVPDETPVGGNAPVTASPRQEPGPAVGGLGPRPPARGAGGPPRTADSPR